MATLLRNLWNDDAGQGLGEYVLIIGLVSIGLMAIIVAFRNSMGKIFVTVADTLDNAEAAGYKGS